MQTASSSLAIDLRTYLNERKQQIATIEGKWNRTKGQGAEVWNGHLKVALEVARWGLIRIVNYGSTISSLNIHYNDSIFHEVQYIISFAIIFCTVVTLEWALESKYNLHLRPQMMKYTMIG